MTVPNFPSSPTDGQTFTVNGITYTWDANGDETGYWKATTAVDADPTFDTLGVTGATTLSGDTTMNGPVDVNSTATFDGSTTFAQAVDSVTTLTAADTTTVTPNFGEGNVFEFAHTITTMAAPSNAVAGQSGVFIWLTGGSVTGWDTDTYEWPGDVPTPTAPAIVPFFVRVGGGSPRVMMGVATEEID
jgi:hypothetical protein